jgi:hypothetical protein
VAPVAASAGPTAASASSSSKKSAKKAAKSAKKQAKQQPQQPSSTDGAMSASHADFQSRARDWAATVLDLALRHEALRSAVLEGWRLLRWLEVRGLLLIHVPMLTVPWRFVSATYCMQETSQGMANVGVRVFVSSVYVVYVSSTCWDNALRS